MASLKDSLLDGMSGKLDKYIIYQVGNETFIRKRPKKVSNPKSEKQQMQRAKLPGAQTMYKALEGSLLKEICNLAARYNEKRSGYHWFLGKNMNLFGANNYIDYSRLEFSDGSQQLPFGTTMKQPQPNTVELHWTDNSSSITAQSTDRLMVAVIFDNEPYTYLRGFGLSLAPALLTMAGVCGVRIMWVRLVFPRYSTFQTIMMAYPISLITTTLLIFIALLYYRPAKRFARMEEPL